MCFISIGFVDLVLLFICKVLGISGIKEMKVLKKVLVVWENLKFFNSDSSTYVIMNSVF